MKVNAVVQGEIVNLPIASKTGKKSDSGWTATRAPMDGLVLVLDASEKNSAGLFISLSDMINHLDVIKQKKILVASALAETEAKKKKPARKSSRKNIKKPAAKKKKSAKKAKKSKKK